MDWEIVLSVAFVDVYEQSTEFLFAAFSVYINTPLKRKHTDNKVGALPLFSPS